MGAEEGTDVRDKREAELRRLGVGREGGRKAKRTGRI
jgi:hypothetical protein